MANQRIDMINAIKIVADANGEAWSGFGVTEPIGIGTSAGFTDDFTDEQWNEYVTIPAGSNVTAAAVRSVMTQHLADCALKNVHYDRRQNYPEIGAQLDQLYHDMKNGTLNSSGQWYVGITSVKTNIPKPS
tara:strand:- start:36 stop:428 length:393 start_codon:yes stop_codon:yes gene_type:complete